MGIVLRVVNKKPTRCFCLVKHLIIYSMKHSPAWEANRFSASQEIPGILYNPKLQYCIHKCPSSVPLPSHLDPVHPQHPPSRISIIILYTYLHLCLPSGLSLSFGFPQQNPNMPLLSPLRATCPAHYFPLNFGWGVPKIKLMWFSPLPCYRFPPRHKHDTIHTLLNCVTLTNVSKF